MNQSPHMQKKIFEALTLDMNKKLYAIHGSAFHIQDKTILLIGPSGVGKSTLRKHLIQKLGGLVIQDDKPQLVMKHSKLNVKGHSYVSVDCLVFSEKSYNLDAVYILEKADTFTIENTEVDPLVLWNRFGIGIPYDTKPLERVLNKLKEVPTFKVDNVHNEQSLNQLSSHIVDTILTKSSN